MEQYTYDSLEHFIDDVNTCPMDKRESSQEGSFSFSQSKDIADAERIAREGFDLDLIKDRIKPVAHFMSQDIEPVHGMSGAYVDMGEFVSGTPECMVDFPVTENLKFVHLIVDTGENAGVSGKHLVEKAAAVAGLIDRLEGEGYRVRVDIFFGSISGSNFYHSLLVNVKQYKEAVSLGQIAGCIHPAFLRRLCFLHMEKHCARVPSGYGRVVDSVSLVKQGLYGNLNRRDEIIFLPNQRMSGGHPIGNAKEANEWVEYFTQNKLDVWNFNPDDKL